MMYMYTHSYRRVRLFGGFIPRMHIMHSSHREWNRSHIRSIFLQVDADAILKKRISTNETSGQIAWRYCLAL
jgi:hypothetical protein